MEPSLDDLVIKYQETCDRDIRDKIISKGTNLVLSIARKISKNIPSIFDREDIEQMAFIGLMDAAKTFSPNKKTKFSTYCNIRVSGYILDQFRKNDWIPRTTRSSHTKLKQAVHKLRQRLGRKPYNFEIAEEMNMTQEEIHGIITSASRNQNTSINSPVDIKGDNKKVELSEIIEDANANDKMIEIDDMFKTIIGCLSKKERLIMVLYYLHDLTMYEVGSILCVSESRVCQIHAEILIRLKETFGFMASQI